MEDTIAAIATPVGEGGIAIVRMSGPKAVEIGDRTFAGSRKVREMESHTLCYGKAVDGKKVVDEVLVSVMRAPRSYTREDVVEINCHGGMVAARRVLQAVCSHGARLAERGEFTKRAFLNGRIDLAQAEAVIDLVRARTDAAAEAALRLIGGELSGKLTAVREGLVNCLKLLELSLDFAEEDVPLVTAEGTVEMLEKAMESVDELRASYDRGKMLRDGAKVVIVGKPNVGKSSLLNALLREERAIVTPVPGTTRDSVEEWAEIGGIACKLVDTAGIREGGDKVEAEGIRRTRKCVSEADIVVGVFDRSERLDERDKAVCAEMEGRRAVAAMNKCDLVQVAAREQLSQWLDGTPIAQVSATCGTGVERLEQLVARVAVGTMQASDGVTVTRARHKQRLDDAAGALARGRESAAEGLSLEFVAVDVQDALGALAEIAGAGTDEDVLGRIFDEFCIGK